MPDTTVLMNQLIEQRRAFTLGQGTVVPSWDCRLITAPGSVDCTMTFADLTELVVAGYAPIALSPGTWAGGVVACVDTQDYPPLHFAFTAGGVTIVGNCVYDVTNDILGWVTIWGTPFVVPSLGGAVDVSLQWIEKQC